MDEPRAIARTRIWDLPTRLFHWVLTIGVVFSFATGKLGGDWLTWHFRSGYVIAALLLFRFVWGFAGSRYALFSSFLPSPRRIWRRVRAKPDATPASAGHSAIGTLSVYALLLVLAAQIATGVFSNNGSFIEGPWVKFVSGATSDRLSSVHYYTHWLIAALAALHVAAIAFYWLKRKQDLLTPMLTGDKLGISSPPADDGVALRLRAVVLAALAAAVIGYLVAL